MYTMVDILVAFGGGLILGAVVGLMPVVMGSVLKGKRK